MSTNHTVRHRREAHERQKRGEACEERSCDSQGAHALVPSSTRSSRSGSGSALDDAASAAADDAVQRRSAFFLAAVYFLDLNGAIVQNQLDKVSAYNRTTRIERHECHSTNAINNWASDACLGGQQEAHGARGHLVPPILGRDWGCARRKGWGGRLRKSRAPANLWGRLGGRGDVEGATESQTEGLLVFL